MSKKEEFKNFILNKKELIEYVEDNKTTWQKLYELYDLYGENSEVWDKFKETRVIKETTNIKGLLSSIRNINLDSLEDNIIQIQKIVDLVSEFTKKDEEEKEIKPKEEKIDKIFGETNES